MWGALFFDAFATAFTVGTIWMSIARGRLIYQGTQHITRADRPVQFWFWIAFCCLWCAGAFWITLPAIRSGS